MTTPLAQVSGVDCITNTHAWPPMILSKCKEACWSLTLSRQSNALNSNPNTCILWGVCSKPSKSNIIADFQSLQTVVETLSDATDMHQLHVICNVS